MVFFFLLDLTCSVLCSCVFKAGSWVVYKSYDGMHYLYNKNVVANNNTNRVKTIQNANDLSPYVIITEEEYDIMKNEKNDTNKKNCKIHKRNVSSLTKKMVASNQEWKCGSCNQTLDYT